MGKSLHGLEVIVEVRMVREDLVRQCLYSTVLCRTTAVHNLVLVQDAQGDPPLLTQPDTHARGDPHFLPAIALEGGGSLCRDAPRQVVLRDGLSRKQLQKHVVEERIQLRLAEHGDHGGDPVPIVLACALAVVLPITTRSSIRASHRCSFSSTRPASPCPLLQQQVHLVHHAVALAGFHGN